MKNLRILLIFFLVIAIVSSLPAQSKEVKPKVTFIELGSVNCVPCKMMQPVMKAIEEKYGNQVNVVFYDVWTKEQKQYAQIYKIKLIPTQVFLDENGKEFHRHEGFYPEAEIDKILQSKGLKLNSNKK
ncbi:MAG: thioredoxin family protein [Ignavibacterium sp.]|jgi:thioredoxin 1|uniref:thioredoxin family protein n=1 Tax=Ignavibacterium sp. TaxID=2651167 RepID=UPI003297E789